MPAAVEAPAQEWIELPNNRLVSADNGTLTLYGAADMDIDAFNTKANEYGVHIDERDAPIDRLVKVTIYQARKDSDGSSLFTNSEYTDMVLDVAAGKAEEPFKSFYKTLTTGLWDATKEILEFQEKLKTGRNRGKYTATRNVFNEEGELEPADDIIVAPEGWARVLGIKHGYPTETSQKECVVENIENPALEGTDVKGYWYIDSNPEKGEQRIVHRDPNWFGGGLLNASVSRGRSYSSDDVGALRSRDMGTEDYADDIKRIRAKAKRKSDDLRVLQKEIADLSGRFNNLVTEIE